MRDESRRVIATLEARYRESSGAPLKIKHNGVLGYFIEVTPQHADKLMAGEARDLFRHRQTMAGAVRFSTDELASLASRIAEAGERALSLELVLFEEMVAEAVQNAASLGAIAHALAVLDVASALGELSVARRLVRPKMDESLAFDIVRGRHPVVEAALQQSHAGDFVPNDCNLSPDGSGRLWLVTGPNMAGKSTFLRQNALIAILAQAGSFVPADAAHIGIVDRLFSRVGAGDDLAAGRSTFMVEMVETAAILNQATERSLVILDEIGRGTATFDGLAIAWAAVEHLHEKNRSRALFATHYHEMTALAERLSSLACVTMRVREWNDSIVFLHEVALGTADRSYGIHVAKLAGLPPAVVKRAQEVLAALEEGREGHKPLARIDDLPLFSVAPAKAESKSSAVEDALREISPDGSEPARGSGSSLSIEGKIAEMNTSDHPRKFLVVVDKTPECCRRAALRRAPCAAHGRPRHASERRRAGRFPAMEGRGRHHARGSAQGGGKPSAQCVEARERTHRHRTGTGDRTRPSIRLPARAHQARQGHFHSGACGERGEGRARSSCGPVRRHQRTDDSGDHRSRLAQRGSDRRAGVTLALCRGRAR